MRAMVLQIDAMSVLEKNPTVHQFLEDSGVLERTAVIQMLQQEMTRSESGFEDVLAAVERDTSLRDEILNVATSAKFGGNSQRCTLPEAFGRLGLDEFQRTLILSIIKLNLASEVSSDFLRHAELISKLCETIAGKCASDLEFQAFLTGLCHDAAVPAMAESLEDYQYFIDQALSNDPGVLELEAECYEFNHCEAGAALVESMTLPESVSDAIRIHHEPNRLAELSTKSAKLAAILALAERIVQVAKQEIAAAFLGSSEASLRESFLSALEVSTDELNKLVEELVPFCAQRLRQPT